MQYTIFDIETEKVLILNKYCLYLYKQRIMIGIYCIKNKTNGKVYIGSSNNIERRFRRHKTELNTKKHSNKYLERAYQKDGKENFDFTILELCSEENLINREISYIIEYESLNKDKGYNLSIPIKHPTITSNLNYRNTLSEAKKGVTPSNYEQMRQVRWKKVEVSNLEGEILHVFNSLKETEDTLNIKRGNVYNFLSGKTKKIKTHPYLTFKYGENE